MKEVVHHLKAAPPLVTMATLFAILWTELDDRTELDLDVDMDLALRQQG